jgi:tRNA (guanine-N7-)-methyltransferase
LRITASYQADFPAMQHQRHVRSFVLRAGRMTPAQERALKELWPVYGVELRDAPLDLEAIFGRHAPRCLEIGFGVGEVIGALAEERRHIDYLGVEVHAPGVGRLLLRAEQTSLSNLRVIRHDAVEVLRWGLRDESFDEILVFFPDPWHKKRHHKRRLIDDAFVESAAAKLRPSGVLRLATDWQEYAEQMLAVCNASRHLASLSPDRTYVARPDFRPPTRFERRGARLGHGVWDLAYEKRPPSPSEEAAANSVDDELHGKGRENHAG